jgi:ADP-ribose pyrophosphatase
MTDPAGSSVGPAGVDPPGADAAPSEPARGTLGDLTEVVVESEVLRRGHYLTFRIDTIERADGTRAKREVVGHPGAVAILAIDDEDHVLMVRQFRIPAGRVLLEVPAGTLDVDPLTGAVEDHALAAPRELEEETGYRAGSWRLLTSFWTAPGFATELMHLYLATDLRPVDEDRIGPDEDERLELERVPWQDAIAAAERGDIADAKSLVALLWLDRLTQPVPEAVIAPVEPAVAAPAQVAAAVTAPELALEGGAAPEPVLRLSYMPSLGETIRASVAVAQRSRGNQVLGLGFLVLALILGVTNGPAAAIFPAALAVAILGGLVNVLVVLVAFMRRGDLLRQPTDFAAGPAGVDFRNPVTAWHTAWTTFSRLRETSRFVFLETGLSLHYVPKRAFSPDQLAQFRRLIAEAGFGPDGRRPRRSRTGATTSG